MKTRVWISLLLRHYILGLPATLADLVLQSISPSFVVRGIRIIDPIPHTRQSFERLITAAIALIEENDPRRFQRIQREIHLIVNHPTQSAARYSRPLRSCTIDLRCFYDKDQGNTVKLLAFALLHEATHGHLFTVGIAQRAANWRRVEQFCWREARFFSIRIGELGLFKTLQTDSHPEDRLSSRLVRVWQNIEQVGERDFDAEARVWEQGSAKQDPPCSETPPGP